MHLALQSSQLLRQRFGFEEKLLLHLGWADRAEALQLAVVIPQGAQALATALLVFGPFRDQALESLGDDGEGGFTGCHGRDAALEERDERQDVVIAPCPKRPSQLWCNQIQQGAM